MFLRRFWRPAQTFGDSAIDLLGNPYALARTGLRRELERMNLSNVTGQVLDVGCGSMPYRALFSNASVYHGLEIDQARNRANPNVTHWYSGDSLPFADNCYEAVICSQVIEHVFSPECLLAEIFRVLRPGGRLFLTVPFFWPEHEQPHDSQRFTSFGLMHRLLDAGFDSICLCKTNPGLAAILQLTIEWLESLRRNHLKGWPPMLLRMFAFVAYSFMNLIGAGYRSLPLVRRGSATAEIYLDLVVIARR